MTNLLKKEETCLVCGHISEYVIIVSTSSFGSPELDFRPAEPQRSTMRFWSSGAPSPATVPRRSPMGPSRRKKSLPPKATCDNSKMLTIQAWPIHSYAAQ
jgi:hypothetical protein